VLDAVLFDWGGTLTPFHDVDLLDLWRAAATVLAPDRVDEVAAALLAVEDESWTEVHSSCRSTTTAQLLARASERVGLPIDLHDAAIEAYLAGWTPHTEARAEAVSVLTTIRSEGLRTGLLSNTHWPREAHEGWLARDGLLGLLDVRTYTSELTHLKPHRVAFEALIGALDVDPMRCVFVGDRLVDDISGAAAVGMRTVHLPSGRSPDGPVAPDATISDLTELLPLLDTWRA
jgi:putative hydrolase of the HAD superfamily